MKSGEEDDVLARFREGEASFEELEEYVHEKESASAASGAGMMAMRELFLDLEEIMGHIRLLLIIFLLWAAGVTVFALYWYVRLDAWNFASKLIGGG